MYTIPKEITDSRHLDNLNELKEYLVSLDVEFINPDIRTFVLNNGKLEIRYVDSLNHKSLHKKFGIDGVHKKYFHNITKEKMAIGVRVIWIKDFEMEEQTDGYRRKWEVLKSYIRAAVGKIDYKINVRDCEIREISNADAKDFLDKNSFYGYRRANVTLGLFLKKDKYNLKKGECVYIQSFGHPYFGKSKYDVEIIRLSSKTNVIVRGAQSKLLKHFLINYPVLNMGGKSVEVNEIVFIVDSDHNSNAGVEALGFEFVGFKDPGFMNYWVDTGEVKHREPSRHKFIMEQMAIGKVFAIPNAGCAIFKINRKDYLNKSTSTCRPVSA